MNRTTLKVAGESGMGLLSVGRIVAKVLKGMGFYVHSDREYPSLIKGGHSNLQIDFGPAPIRSLSREADLVIALDRAGLMEYLDVIKKGGVLVHGYERHHLIKDLHAKAKKRNIKLMYLPAHTIARNLGGSDVMVNMVLLGLMWKILGFDLKPLENAIRKQFATKPELLKIDLKCVQAGYRPKELKKIPQYKIPVPKKKPKALLLDGNMGVALGAIEAGVRSYFMYPMSPASSILMYLADFSHQTKMVVKQAEDEITAAQMTLGAMFMGSRSFTATSGGGYDLMHETVSLAGMTETPWVCVICQRPGPATGLPTWTGQGDLNMAIHSCHGEFTRLVMAASDPASCYEGIQHAFNYAEEFQIPVIFLSEKTIAEAQTMVDVFKSKIPIKRGIVTGKALEKVVPSDRFKITKNGVSLRWLPGASEMGYYGNGDEHKEDGTLTERGEEVAPMYAKRVRKMETLKNTLPDPVIYGVKKGADFSFVGWGSSKSVMLDVIDEMKKKDVKVNYLHYEYLWPFKEKPAVRFFKENRKVHIMEGNYQGQLANMIEAATGLKFKGRLLKYNGRHFFLEDVMDYIVKHLK
ncbi:2-oxoacid:acceptor oxidoreductase subunit alpha [Candidatus Peregrinibacteria bacterium]|nr:2-oxoacid:acceptor oxidoreductase subunit alpha [Candidatus Peregrinibacteria bacterium]